MSNVVFYPHGYVGLCSLVCKGKKRRTTNAKPLWTRGEKMTNSNSTHIWWKRDKCEYHFCQYANHDYFIHGLKASNDIPNDNSPLKNKSFHQLNVAKWSKLLFERFTSFDFYFCSYFFTLWQPRWAESILATFSDVSTCAVKLFSFSSWFHTASMHPT